jgi:hypothetical protein
MRKIINTISKYLYRSGTLGNVVFTAWQGFVYNKYTDVYFTKAQFKKTFGYPLNLKSPKTFNEKIQWLKLNDMQEINSLCADKFLVRAFIQKEIGDEYLIPLLYKTDNYESISEDKLPHYPVIIKTNHASGQVFIIKDKTIQNFDEIRSSLKYQLRNNFYHGLREIQYKNIAPCIIVEKLLQDEWGNVPKDYKVHCFNGKPKYIQIDTGRYVDQKRVIYDTNWNFIDIKWKEQEGKPVTLDKMIELATLLSKSFIYVRVDFYEVKGKLYFGELTFTPGAGKQKFESLDIDRLWGDKIQLPFQ